MIKKIIKKFFAVLLFLAIGFGIFLGYQYIQYKNNEVDDLKREVQAQTSADLEKELLNKNLENAKNYVENIKFIFFYNNISS